VKERMAWTRKVIREVIWCCMYCRKYLAGSYKKVQEIWRKLNPDCRMNMNGKKLISYKNYIMEKNKDIGDGD
jgi:hypothetical protein